MGIQLDWQVDSERDSRRSSEDPNTHRSRRRRRRRMVVVIGLLVGIFACLFLVVQWRLEQVDARVEDELRDTVDIEMTTLRVGNVNNYLDIQRSASEDWVEGQRQFFNNYQLLKQQELVNWDYEIVDLHIDGDQRRARVVIEQELDNVPYRMVWFYWRYNDLRDARTGWRHVPADIEFWGDQQTIRRDAVHITYFDLDRELAEALAPQIDQWWAEGCALLACPNALPRLTIEIVPETLEGPTWDLYNPWLLRIPSPYHSDGLVRYDSIVSADLYAALQQILIEKIITHRAGVSFTPTPYTDIFWIKEQIGLWLIGEMTDGAEGGSPFISSLAATFGVDFPSRMMVGFTPDAQIGFVQTAFGLAMPDMPIDSLNAIIWTDFFQWRLRAEQVAQGGDSNAFRDFYDTGDGNALAVAQQRYESRDPNSPIPRVTGVVIGYDELGRLIATVAVLPNPEDPNVQAVVVFRWVGSTWKRIS